jgi:hypothetical protein
MWLNARSAHLQEAVMNARFDVESQSGGTISNVGRDQHIHLTPEDRRRRRAAKAISLLGIALLAAGLVGAGVLVIVALQDVLGALDDETLSSNWGTYVPGEWPYVLAAILAGLVLSRTGRVLDR